MHALSSHEKAGPLVLLVLTSIHELESHPTSLWRLSICFICDIKSRCAQLVDHCFRAEEEITSSLLLYSPVAPSRSRRLSYPDVIGRDAMLTGGALNQYCETGSSNVSG